MKLVSAALVALLLVVALPASAAAAPSEPLRILAIGDSITHGEVTNPTWRYYLYTSLTGAGWTVDMVGPHFGAHKPGATADGCDGEPDPQPSNFDFDQDHMAQWGRTANWALGMLTGECREEVASYSPNVAIVHIGTNDLKTTSASTIRTRLEGIVAALRDINPGITVLMAQMYGWADDHPDCSDSCHDNTPKLRDEIAALTAALDSGGSRVIAVDQYSMIDPAQDLRDGVHPTPDGDRKIADQWIKVLASVFDTGTPPPPPPPPDVVPAARSILSACPDGKVPAGGFADVAAGSTHAAAIDCVAWWQVTRGVQPGTYAPAQAVTRAQMATFLARLLERSGTELPSGAPAAFNDLGDSVHADAINALHAAGIVNGKGGGRYDPNGTVTREQMASFLARALGREGADVPDYFVDDASSAHQANINVIAALGVTGGSGGRAYNPAGVVRRDQMASFLARALAYRVDEDDASLPG